MVKSEYVKIHSAEGVYVQKQLLHTELEFLNLVKSMGIYKLLRSEELLLKVKLKGLVGESVLLFEKLQKSLPTSNYKLPESEKVKLSRKDKEKLSLEQEIAEIKRKILSLQNSF